MKIKNHFHITFKLCAWPHFEKEASNNTEKTYSPPQTQ